MNQEPRLVLHCIRKSICWFFDTLCPLHPSSGVVTISISIDAPESTTSSLSSGSRFDGRGKVRRYVIFWGIFFWGISQSFANDNTADVFSTTFTVNNKIHIYPIL